MTNKIKSTSIILAVLISVCMMPAAVKSQAKTGYGRYVNPFIGTAPLTDPKIIGYTPPKNWRVWAGLTYPGSTLPNAMVQLSPITEYHTGAGYQYEDTMIYGFIHTDKGHWNLCNIPILPVSGSSAGNSKFGSHFSHQTESASPAFYKVFLDDYKVDVRLTSTLRCGFHQYKFSNPQNKQILFDLAKANNNVRGWNIEQVGDKNLQGYQDMGGDKIYFYVSLNTGIKQLENRDKNSKNGFALVHLTDGGNGLVELKIGLSFVSIANAKQNLEQEIGNKTFDAIHQEGVKIWESLLSKVQVKGGTEKEKQLFYSSLYRSFQWPALRSDVNGEYTDVKGKVIKADFNYYTLPSLWDTYRNKLVLLSMLSPKVTLDVIKTLKDIGDKTGFIPTFFHGDHASAFIAGAYQRGITNFDVKDVYRLLLRNATVEGGTRPFISEYIQKGYISTPQVDSPKVETKGKAGVAKTLEYAFDDYAVAQLAKILKDDANYKTLMARSKNYKNVFDPATRFMRGRLENGDWVKNFNPQYPYYEYMYREANAWQVSFFAPQDMPGLVELYGGKNKFESKLDSLFTVPWNPNYIARNVSGFIGQYCQGNQPDHEAPFSYYFVDKPEKSQKVLDNIMQNFYGIGKEGLALSGMDDAGEMSAWYVFSSTGLYPFSAADTKYIVSVPVFDEVKWTMPNNSELIIKKSGKSRELADVLVDKRSNKSYFVSYDLFKKGGSIEVKTK
ncbi:MAG: glycoside hydrolase family 92 protein [Sphingobacteriaceae bacterium]|nr:MAG: glycoside hydrolase family 92 protein [Sphingobacteriaceae bacterium]